MCSGKESFKVRITTVLCCLGFFIVTWLILVVFCFSSLRVAGSEIRSLDSTICQLEVTSRMEGVSGSREEEARANGKIFEEEIAMLLTQLQGCEQKLMKGSEDEEVELEEERKKHDWSIDTVTDKYSWEEKFKIETVTVQGVMKKIWRMGDCVYEKYVKVVNRKKKHYINDVEVPRMLKSGHYEVEIPSREWLKLGNFLLELLEIFSDFAEKNNVVYSHRNGNLLGWCRDKTLLAWDDDIDIVMRKKDFVKFEYLFETGKYMYPNVFEVSESWEGWSIYGPKIVEWGGREFVMFIYPREYYIKFLHKEDFEVNPRAKTWSGTHVDIDTPLTWDEKEHRGLSNFGHFYDGVGPDDQNEDYPLENLCGISTRITNRCEEWLDNTFGTGYSGWNVKSHPEVRRLRSLYNGKNINEDGLYT